MAFSIKKLFLPGVHTSQAKRVFKRTQLIIYIVLSIVPFFRIGYDRPSYLTHSVNHYAARVAAAIFFTSSPSKHTGFITGS